MKKKKQSPRFGRDDRVTAPGYPDDVFTVLSSQPAGNSFIVYLISDANICRFIAEDDLVPLPHGFMVGDMVTMLDDPDEGFIYRVLSFHSSFGEDYAVLDDLAGAQLDVEVEFLCLATPVALTPTATPTLLPGKFIVGDVVSHLWRSGEFVVARVAASEAIIDDIISGTTHLAPFSVLTLLRHLAPSPTPSPDNVNHPAHYTSDPSGVECWTVTRHRNFNIGNAFKYLWRAGLKEQDNPEKHVEDLLKAVAYIEDEIRLLR